MSSPYIIEDKHSGVDVPNNAKTLDEAIEFAKSKLAQNWDCLVVWQQQGNIRVAEVRSFHVWRKRGY